MLRLVTLLPLRLLRLWRTLLLLPAPFLRAPFLPAPRLVGFALSVLLLAALAVAAPLALSVALRVRR
jgi:hypothetical protein